mmetsp:Transcript_24/g.39  ORF Transcript_24/g.39 Transcript_24/m.39 type:complete len:858 (-) Transcript_24:741-3314(-)|eukprot:CAMPEP_0184651124 /NCGR_PEP_ID=MMETSP0308-20130426/8702_1 /TAXON_ID=38269 /ORGANISM="Gloeochaete witrockiana, Strain SAG 46.84" /LENGTH=857 /DNA_ID=CAMNT_0027085121 /DNA_START=164 /DNA_END=2737 /DNA_ORIENTATION=-
MSASDSPEGSNCVTQSAKSSEFQITSQESVVHDRILAFSSTPSLRVGQTVEIQQPFAKSSPGAFCGLLSKPFSFSVASDITLDEWSDRGIRPPTWRFFASSDTTPSFTIAGVLVPTIRSRQTMHVVNRGENLFRLSSRYGVPIPTLMEANALPDHLIAVGQRLKVPPNVQNLLHVESFRLMGSAVLPLSLSSRPSVPVPKHTGLISAFLTPPAVSLPVPHMPPSLGHTSPNTCQPTLANPSSTHPVHTAPTSTAAPPVSVTSEVPSPSPSSPALIHPPPIITSFSSNPTAPNMVASSKRSASGLTVKIPSSSSDKSPAESPRTPSASVKALLEPSKVTVVTPSESPKTQAPDSPKVVAAATKVVSPKAMSPSSAKPVAVESRTVTVAESPKPTSPATRVPESLTVSAKAPEHTLTFAAAARAMEPPVRAPVVEKISKTSPPPKVHVVQRGQTLVGIGRLYNSSAEDIMAFNNLQSPIIPVGLHVRVPPAGYVNPNPSPLLSSSPAPLPQTKVSVAEIPKPAPASVPVSSKVPFSAMAETPKAATAPLPPPSPRITSHANSSTSVGSHVVQPGETVSQIAQMHKVPAEALLRLNGLDYPNQIQVDQVLILPPKNMRWGDLAKPPPTPAKENVYVVRRGESLRTIAAKLKISPATIASMNNIRSIYAPLTPNQSLRIPLKQESGKHTVRVGDSLEIIAHEYGLSVSMLKQANPQLHANSIVIGESLAIPPAPGKVFGKPTQAGFPSSLFGWRRGRMHQGVDIAAEPGTAVFATQEGIVRFAGWCGNFGNLVEILHLNGFVTRYGHVSSIFVKEGQRVDKGDTIAAVGSTGRSTGPHLHFELRKRGSAVNPLDYAEIERA